jgi:hypothetical protein
LDSSAKQYADLDSQQKELLGIIRESRETLERESHGRLTTAIPEIAEQNKTMENIERRVDAARSKLAEESDLVSLKAVRTDNSWPKLISRLRRIGDCCLFLLPRHGITFQHPLSHQKNILEKIPEIHLSTEGTRTQRTSQNLSQDGNASSVRTLIPIA